MELIHQYIKLQTYYADGDDKNNVLPRKKRLKWTMGHRPTIDGQESDALKHPITGN